MTFPPPGPVDPTPQAPSQPGAPHQAPHAHPGQPGAWGPGPGGYMSPNGPVPPKKSNSLAIIGFVLSVVGLMLCLIPFINFFAAVLALAGLVLGVLGLLKARKIGSGKGLSIAAIIISVVAGIGVVVSQVVFVAAMQELEKNDPIVSESIVPDDPATGDAPADAGADAPADDGAGAEEFASPALAFGEIAAFEDGLELGASAPSAFTPSDTAAGTDQFTQFVRVDVTVTNGTAETYDPSLTYVTASSGGAEASQVFDSGQGIGSGPSTTLLPGQSVTFPVVFGVADPADLTFEVRPGAWEYSSVLFSTTG